MGAEMIRSRGSALASLAIAVSLACFGGLISTAFAAETYVLDPFLSLTGDCSTSKADPVPDPGCPGGTHPPKAFTSPRSAVTDAYGNIYVASFGSNGADGRIDIFDSEGFFIEEIAAPSGPKDLAVDSKGNLYAFEFQVEINARVVRYEPTLYNPGAGEIKYGKAPVTVVEKEGPFLDSIAINPANDRLFVNWGDSVTEYGSAAEENKALESFGSGVINNLNGEGLAIDAAHKRIYAGDKEAIRVFNLNPPHELLKTIDGSETPTEKFSMRISVAANEATGSLFVLDGESSRNLYEFGEDGKFVITVKKNLAPIFGSETWVDNGVFSPNQGYLFATSESAGIGNALAFEPPPEEVPPEVESASFSEVTESEAELEAVVKPISLETTYTLEYTTQERFESEGFDGATIAGTGKLPAGSVGVPVSAPAVELSPETEYRFRVVAENAKGSDEAEGTFTTFLAVEPVFPCPNDTTRTGPSLLLPDCRAYELVTPPDTNARSPQGVGHLGVYFPTRESSPDGERVSFIVEGGIIPGNEGTGSFSGDAYLSTRGAEGWSTASAGPNGVESPAPLTGSTSPDQGYSFWESSGEGTAAVEGRQTSYVRYPDGHSALVGRGSIADDPHAQGKLISEYGEHIIFVSPNIVGHTSIQLEENAPPDGTAAIYDRTADEVTHVVSLLPHNVIPGAGQDASYLGASLDGKGVAFTIGTTLYLRYHNEETYEVAKGVTFTGIAEGGGRIFYVEGGDLFAFDVATEEVIAFSESGDATVVNVSSDGTAAYFVSPSVLTSEPNPKGVTPLAGKENLYLSREGAISFVGTVTKRDVEGESNGNVQVEGLGLWTEAANGGGFGIDPSRTTLTGNTILFESRANLTGYESAGHAEVYRYDNSLGELQCLSCNPTQKPASGEASLQSISEDIGKPEPFSSYALVNNLRANGDRAFFQSDEGLVVGDTDGLQDIYEWEAQGVGSCLRPKGCVYLISYGHSDRIDYLYAVSDSGNDIFFRTSDRLVKADTESTPSIYDARVDGGFAEKGGVVCRIEMNCPETLTPPPALEVPGSEATGASGNLPPEVSPKPRHCPKGKRRVKRNGKFVCIKKHHRRSGTQRGAGK